MEKKPVSEWEHEKGLMLIEVEDLQAEVTENEFLELAGAGLTNAKGVDFPGREEWLQKNNYPITRENMMDPNLPSTVEPEPSDV